MDRRGARPPVVASGTAGRKKDAETECAVDACTKLDSKGLLRTDTSISAALAEERRKRMRELFGDQDDHSDDDDFFDRASSGTGERRRAEVPAEGRSLRLRCGALRAGWAVGGRAPPAKSGAEEGAQQAAGRHVRVAQPEAA